MAKKTFPDEPFLKMVPTKFQSSIRTFFFEVLKKKLRIFNFDRADFMLIRKSRKFGARQGSEEKPDNQGEKTLFFR